MLTYSRYCYYLVLFCLTSQKELILNYLILQWWRCLLGELDFILVVFIIVVKRWLTEPSLHKYKGQWRRGILCKNVTAVSVHVLLVAYYNWLKYIITCVKETVCRFLYESDIVHLYIAVNVLVYLERVWEIQYWAQTGLRRGVVHILHGSLRLISSLTKLRIVKP